jgi:ethylmalonyl-CoA/methylmalonyl-CoA decarboxylase
MKKLWQKRNHSSFSNRYSPFLKSVHSNGKFSNGKITIKYIDKIGYISIDNPSSRNSINGKMMNDFAEVVDDVFIENPLAIVIKGEGQYFCSGADFSLTKHEINTSENGGRMYDFMTNILNALRNSPILSVCMINGPAIGGGAELTTCCDFRIMNVNSYIQFVHAKLGVSPGWGGATRLISIVGRQNALRLLASSPKVNTTEAINIKLVDASYDSVDDSSTSALEFLDSYLSQPYQSSIRGIKSIIAESEKSFQDSRSIERQIFTQLWCGPDNTEAINNFLKKPSK